MEKEVNDPINLDIDLCRVGYLPFTVWFIAQDSKQRGFNCSTHNACKQFDVNKELTLVFLLLASILLQKYLVNVIVFLLHL